MPDDHTSPSETDLRKDGARLFVADWERSVIIYDDLTDDLLKKLSMQILRLRAAGNEPITVAIDSYGGSLSIVDTLLGLLRGPMQVGASLRITTVVTNRAYSAAATLLSLGDYAVAFPHAEILFHDVRYEGLRDVTPSKARETAKALNALNESYALRLAKRVMSRLVWIYSNLSKDIPACRQRFQSTAKQFDAMFVDYSLGENPGGVDFSGFAVLLWARLSRANDQLVKDAGKKLQRWIESRSIEQSVPLKRQKGSRVPGLLDGAAHLYAKLQKKNPFAFGDSVLRDPQLSDLGLLFALAVDRLASSASRFVTIEELLDAIAADYVMSKSFDDARHLGYISKIITEHSWTFFGRDIRGELDEKSSDQNRAILAPAMPAARLFWFFCIFLCRTLFEGDHVLTPSDAQLLGLIDEVCGGGPVESLREYMVQTMA